MNRREFLTSTAMAMAFSPLLLSAEKMKATSQKYEFCAFTKPLQFLNYDELADAGAEIGVDGIEVAVRPGGHVLPERAGTDLPRLHEALKKRGLKISILTSAINSIDSPHAEPVLRFARELGITRYRMLWYQYDLEKPIGPQLDALKPKLEELATFNRQIGVTGLYQNHSGDRYVGAPIWDIYSLLKNIDPKEIAIAYDTRHATVEGGLSWPIQLQLIKSQIGALFVKDFTWENGKIKNVPLGSGLVDRKLFGIVKESGFTGPVSIHVEYAEKSKEKKVITAAFANDLRTAKELLT